MNNTNPYHNTNLKSSFELISLQLGTHDLIEFRILLQIIKKNYWRRHIMFLVLSILSILPILTIYSLVSTTSTIGILTYTISFLLFFVIGMRYTIFQNYPYLNPVTYTWFTFLQKRNIEGLSLSNLYQYAESHIEKTNPGVILTNQ